MAKLYLVRLTGGTSQGPYSIYYNIVSNNTIATIEDTGNLATGISYTSLFSVSGVTVSVPDSTSSIIVLNEDCDITSPPYTILEPIVRLNVTYEGCNYNDSIYGGRFNFTLNHPLGDQLTIQQSTGLTSLYVLENSSTIVAYPVFPVVFNPGVTGVTVNATNNRTTSDPYPFLTSQFKNNNIMISGVIYGETSGTTIFMPNGQEIHWFENNNPLLNTNFEPDFGYDNTFCIPPTPSPSPSPSPTPSLTPTPTFTQPPTKSPNPTSTPTPTPTSGIVPCDQGMDVVFVIDYTGSMGGVINNIKTSISAITDTIVTESGGDYRLGLVIFDEYQHGSAPSYATLSGYTALTVNQRFVNENPTCCVNGRDQYITALQLMSTNNKTSFINQLTPLNTVNFPLGSGFFAPEPSDLALNLIINQGFAGSFRNNVSKLIVLITDNYPSGDNDTYDQDDIARLTGLTVSAVNQGIRVILMRNPINVTWDYLNVMATGTSGFYVSGYSPSEIINAIEDICATPAPTPSPTPAGTAPTSTPGRTPYPTPPLGTGPTPTPSGTGIIPTATPARTLPILTIAPKPGLLVSNYSNGTILSIIGTNSESFFIEPADFFPLYQEEIKSTSQFGYNKTIYVTVDGPSIGGCLSMYKNGELSKNLVVYSGINTYSFEEYIYGGFTSSDNIEFELRNGVCVI